MVMDVQVDSTRVFVKGLPPSLTSQQLALHFAQQYKVTDAHVIPERRIGFVGFDDNDVAQKAVQYFNRSYIRMSKISVDLAKPIEVHRDASGQAVPLSKRNTTHPDRNRPEIVHPSSSTDDAGRRKRKRGTKDDGEVERATSQVDGASAPAISDNSGNQSSGENAHSDDQEETEETTAKSDNDWLRGKTNRVLDLVDPDKSLQPDPAVDTKPQVEEGDTLESQAPHGEIHAGTKDEGDQDHQTVPNGRLFIRNLAFDVTNADLENRFTQFGKIQEAHVIKDARKSVSKGLAFIQYSEPNAAANALRSLDGVAFHGRLLHILPASDKRELGLTEFDLSKMPLKKQKAIRRKMEAGNATFSWNSLYMNPDAVISSVADRLGVAKSDILDPTSSDAAVKQAHAETRLIAETKQYLKEHGVLIDAFKNQRRDDRVLLLKNFPYGTLEKDLKDLLEPFGEISRFILPPAGTMALAQYVEPYSASQALRQLAYKNIKGSVLYLEKAPQALMDEKSQLSSVSVSGKNAEPEVSTDQDVSRSDTSATLFVRNLNFATTTGRLTEAFGPLPGFSSARVKTRIDPKRPGEILSMGFGFVEFKSRTFADVAVSTLNGHRLDGHELIVQHSSKTSDLAEERRKADIAKKSNANKTKIIIKNLPFQTSRKDVRALFSQYGQLKTIRVPKKFDQSSRGFGFAEFITAKEAQNAVDALSDTHLLGRRLVLEFAQEDEIDPEEQIQAMERKMEQQSNRIQLSKLTGTGRKKFVLGIDEET